MQGEPGAGLRGEKGEFGSPGPRVSATGPLFSYDNKTQDMQTRCSDEDVL